MSMVSFNLSISGTASPEYELPLLKKPPEITIYPSSGITSANISAENAHDVAFNPHIQMTNECVEYIKMTDIQLLRPCQVYSIIINYQLASGSSGSEKLQIRSRIPLHISSEHTTWKSHDLRVANRRIEIIPTDNSGHSHCNPILGLEEVGKRLEDHLQTAVVWLQGGPGGGKTTYLELLQKHLCGEGNKWCIIRLNGAQMGKGRDVESLRREIPLSIMEAGPSEVRNNNLEQCSSSWRNLLTDFSALIRTRLRHVHVVIFLDEYDVYSMKLKAKEFSVESEVTNVLKNTVCEIATSCEGCTLVLVDQTPPPNSLLEMFRPQEGGSSSAQSVASSPKLTFEHWRLVSNFQPEDLRDILMKLPISGDKEEIEALSVRIWTWTRGYPLLTITLIYQYIQVLTGQHNAVTLEKNAKQLVDAIAVCDRSREYVRHVVCEKKWGPNSGNRMSRLNNSEKRSLRELKQKPVIANPEQSLVEKGLLEKRMSQIGEDVYVVPVPLIRFHLPDILNDC